MAEREPPGPSRITVLRAPDKRLTKTYTPGAGGKVVKRSYDNAKHFRTEVREFRGVDGLAGLLRELGTRTDCCVVRGAPGRYFPPDGRPVLRRIHAAEELVDDRGRFQKPARKPREAAFQDSEIAAGRLRWVTVLPMFEERPTDWLLLDFDGLNAPAGIDWREDFAWTADFLRRQLPAPFHGCRCIYYATSSAADPGKPDLGGPTIKLRLGFSLDRGVTFAEARRWLAGVEGLDTCTLRPIQVTYTAAPLFAGGLSDPLPVRLGVLEGEQERVAVPAIEVQRRHQREAFTFLGPVKSAEGLGLVRRHPRLDAELAKLAEGGGAAGSVRDQILQCAFAYVADAGRDHVDIDALADFLAGVAGQYRSAVEVDGYGIDRMIVWAIERSPPEPLAEPHHPDTGLTPEEASARVRAEVSAAVGAAVAWRETAAEGEEPPVVGIKAGAGIGKTGAAIEALAAIPGIENLNIEVYVPSHKLGAEWGDRADAEIEKATMPWNFEGIDLNIRARTLVIKGRAAPGRDGTPLCVRHELAEKLGKAGIAVNSTMCKLKVAKGEPPLLCGDYAACRYQEQVRDTGPAIRIMAHANLFTPRHPLPAPDLVLIDEAFHSGAIRHAELPLDRLAETGRWRIYPGRAEGGFAALARREADDKRIDAEFIATKVHAALAEGRDPRTVTTAADCRFMAGVEYGSMEGPPIVPDMPYDAQRKAWAGWKRDECAKAGRFWKLLEQEHEHPDRPLQRIELEHNAVVEGGGARHILHLHRRAVLQLPAAPVILLDADLDPIIARKFFPEIRVVDVPAKQNARVVQVVDRTCSKRQLLGDERNPADQPRADRRLAELEGMAGRLLGEGGLLVTYKDALARMALAPGVDTLHLGNLRGRDGYKHHDRIIIAGRLEPAVRQLERDAKALFGDEPEPIATVPELGHGGTRMPTEQRRYRMAGGKAGPAVAVSVHPDPRVQSMVEQMRERELEQAAARLRLVHRAEPATVYLLTNLPVNLEVDEMVSWSDLARDREAEACRCWAGVWLLSPSEQSRVAPGLWPTGKAAQRARQEKGYPNPSSNNPRAPWVPFPPYPAWGITALAREAVTLVEYRRAGQRGSAHRAFVPGDVWCEVTARADLEAVAGPVAGLAILGVVRRERPEVLVSRSEPAPLDVPLVAHVADRLPVLDELWLIPKREPGRRPWAVSTSTACIVPGAPMMLHLEVGMDGDPPVRVRVDPAPDGKGAELWVEPRRPRPIAAAGP